jgi:hypothetical protein
VSELHIFRSEPDEQVRELIQEITDGESMQIALHEEDVDYDQLVDTLFSHDQVISWW